MRAVVVSHKPGGNCLKYIGDKDPPRGWRKRIYRFSESPLFQSTMTVFICANVYCHVMALETFQLISWLRAVLYLRIFRLVKKHDALQLIGSTIGNGIPVIFAGLGLMLWWSVIVGTTAFDFIGKVNEGFVLPATDNFGTFTGSLTLMFRIMCGLGRGGLLVDVNIEQLLLRWHIANIKGTVTVLSVVLSTITIAAMARIVAPFSNGMGTRCNGV